MTKENFSKTILSNGIKIISEHIDTVHSISLGFWILSGSKDESTKTNGITHLFEHLAFKSTKNRTAFQIGNDIESLGGSINAFTTKNTTCFYVRLMQEHIEQGIDVLSDLIMNPDFNDDDLEKEKSVVIEEIKDIEDTPGDIIFDFFSQQLFPNHPLGRSIQGTEESIKNLSKKDILDFIKDNYNSDNLIISAAGNIEHDNLVRLVKKYLDKFRIGKKIKKTPRITPVIDKIKTYERSIQQVHYITGRRIFPQSDPRRLQLAVLNLILSAGMSSRLFHNIREKYGFIYSIYSFHDFNIDQGVFGIYTATDVTKIDIVSDLIFNEFNNLIEEKITSQEFKKVKQQFKGGLVIGLESMSSRMNRLAKMEIFEKRLLPIDELLMIIEKITREDIQELAKYLFQRDKFITTIIKPKSN